MIGSNITMNGGQHMQVLVIDEAHTVSRWNLSRSAYCPEHIALPDFAGLLRLSDGSAHSTHFACRLSEGRLRPIQSEPRNGPRLMQPPRTSLEKVRGKGRLTSRMNDQDLLALWYARDDLDLEIETGKPVHPYGCPVRVRRLGEVPLPDCHDSSELIFRVCVERRDVHDIIEGAACGDECSLEVVEGQLDLTFEIGFGCSIATAADLPRNKKQIV
jgi:hypothetical protein